MTDKKPISKETKKKKVIKKKRKRPQCFLGNRKKPERKMQIEDKTGAKTGIKKRRWIILLILLAIVVAAGGITFGVYSHKKKIRRQEAMKMMQEARAVRKQKERNQKERYLEAVSQRVQTAQGLQKAWEDLWLEEIELTAENQDTFATIESCLISAEDTSLVEIKGTLPGIPKSDSDDIYIFPLNTYETTISEGAQPADTFRIEKTKATFTFHVNLNNRQANSRMFKKFVVAAKVDGKYKIISRSRYITNPEAVAKYNVYTPASSIKGLLVDPSRLNTGELEDLGVKQAAYNIPFSKITGQTTSANYPTIHYTYNGKTYAIDGQAVAEYDIVFGSLSKKGIRTTAILLNDMNYEYPELVHPQARSGSTAPYLMFNGAESAGIDAMAAIATFLAERYSGTGHGTVSNWVIANEINARSHWNYMQYL